jgi:lipopolysaccharide/colanic/teichoic acid biosynthesis glycosyltransferase
MAAGVAGLVAAMSKIHAAENGYDYTNSPRLAWSVALVALIVLTAYGTGLPDLTRGRLDAARAALIVVVVAGLGVSVVQMFVGDALLPRFVLGTTLILLFPWLIACSSISVRGRARRQARDRVVLVGSAADAEALRDELSLDVEVPATLVCNLDCDVVTAGQGQTLFDVAIDSAATVIVLSREAQARDEIVREAARLHEMGVRIRTLSLFYEQWLGKVPITELERVSLLYDISEVHRAIYGRASRIADAALAAIALVGLVVVIPFVFVGNLVSNRGPLFYRQPRVGKNGVEFQILKFRTMVAGGPSLANEWTTEDDPRITPFGRVLRRTHIDELPQLLNILRGDLSLVGPRPEQPHYVAELTTKLPFYGLRHLVTPGLTGWAQVKYGYAGSESDALEKLQYEFFYLRHQSLGLVVKILFRTFRHVVNAGGR